jgi:hypothetical protein
MLDEVGMEGGGVEGATGPTREALADVGALVLF